LNVLGKQTPYYSTPSKPESWQKRKETSEFVAMTRVLVNFENTQHK
jgi:hypothetical protein